MGKKAPKAPTPVNPTVVAGAQTQSNQENAAYQQKLNMVNSQGPVSSTNWSADANAPGGYKQTTTLDPHLQNLATMYENRLDQDPGYSYAYDNNYQNTVNPNNEVSNAMYAQAKSRLDPQFTQGDSQIRTQLANQGLTPGSEAYDRAYMNFNRSKNDAYNQANWSSIQAGETAGLNRANLYNDALNNRNATVDSRNAVVAQNRGQMMGGIQGLYALGQSSMPQYSPVGVAPTDVTGAYGLNAQMQNNAYNAKAANYQSGLSGLFSLGSAALTAFNPLAGLGMSALGGAAGGAGHATAAASRLR